MTANIYVYYTVSDVHMTLARQAVMRILSEIQGKTNILGRLLRRCDDPMTWMEVYENVVDTEHFKQELREAVIRCGFNNSLLSEGSARVVEIFVEDVLIPGGLEGVLCA